MRSRRLHIILLLLLLPVVKLWPQADALSEERSVGRLLRNSEQVRGVKFDSLYRAVGYDTLTPPVQAFDKGFADKYAADNAFDYGRDKHNNLWDRIKRAIRSWIAWLFAYEDEKRMSLTHIILLAGAGVIVVLLLFWLVRYATNRSGRWFFQKKNEVLPPDIHNAESLIRSADFARLIRQQEAEGNTREAIRLYYLWLLQDMNANGLISWMPEKTNTDYLFELRDEARRQQFAYLSYLFNYIWYGRFSIGDTDYQSASCSFLKYLKKEDADE